VLPPEKIQKLYFGLFSNISCMKKFAENLTGGYLAEKFGGKWFLGLGSMVTAVFTLLTPVAAKWGTGPLIAVRIIEGLGEVLKFYIR
jgi:MFS family permease